MPNMHMKLEVSSHLAEQERVREFVNKFCRKGKRSGLDEKSVWQLELVVNEAVTNIIEHAYEGRSDRRILIEAEAFPDRIVVRLKYGGKPFDPPAEVPPPPLNGSQDRGFGLFLMEKCVDEITYSRQENGENSICFVKKL